MFIENWPSRPRRLAFIFLRPEFVPSEASCLVTFDCPLAEAGLVLVRCLVLMLSLALQPSLQLGVYFSKNVVLGLLSLLEDTSSKLSILGCPRQGQFLCVG